MMAVGMVQLQGVSRGFWCVCAPEPVRVDGPDCLVSQCHAADHTPGDSAHGCAESGHGHDSNAPCDQDHQHHEVREALRTTAVAASVPVPAPMEHDLPPSLIVSAGLRLIAMAAPACEAWPGGSRCGGPPTPVCAARTMVMLV